MTELNGNNSEAEHLDNTKKSSTSSVAASEPVVRIYNSANVLQQNISKKQGVSGESCDVNIIGCSSDILIRKFEKDFKWVHNGTMKESWLRHFIHEQI